MLVQTFSVDFSQDISKSPLSISKSTRVYGHTRPTNYSTSQSKSGMRINSKLEFLTLIFVCMAIVDGLEPSTHVLERVDPSNFITLSPSKLKTLNFRV